MTDLLKEVFSNVTIYPTIGNHDAFPSNQMPADEGRDYYDQLLKVSNWNILLKPEEQDQFLKGGFYSCLIRPGLRIISLNTNLYYSLDKETVSKTDPGNQLQWLDQQLRYASDHGEKTILMAHVPPGSFERSLNITWMYTAFNDRLVDILKKHNHVISAQIYGHEHTDSFKIIYDGKIPVSVLLMAPAVSPMNSSLPGVGPNNPGIRLYFYRRTTGEIINYHQYYLNLKKIHPVSNSANWELEYRALEDMLVTDMSPQSFDNLVKEFPKKEMAKFQKYLQYNTVSYREKSTLKPDAKEFQQHVCAITRLTTDSYQACISMSPNAYLLLKSPEGPQSKNKGPELPIYTYYVVTAFAALTFLVLVVMSVVRKQCTRTPALPFRYRPLTNDCQYVQRERAT
ncbi:SMPDL3 [Acanthosepion pharaonis]|uniref:SMPDL3 n=1 Tax=Acanthosepion pharaonis TaxID=158019 RepID=A0A812DGT6_ACAPH|nr:SMPDL3 [Sepia pharaonis]